jgi:hypothetical protein
MAEPEPTYPYHPEAPITVPYAGSDALIAQFGDIRVTGTTVYTPAGAFPLAGSTWAVAERWDAEQKIPTWAIVMAIVGFLILTVFSLLFLLVKETVYRGHVQVHVSSGPQQYATWIPVSDRAQAQYLQAQVNYVRSVAG